MKVLWQGGVSENVGFNLERTPMLVTSFPWIECRLFGRLDGVSSSEQDTFGSVDNGHRMTRHLENTKALASS